MSWYYEKLQDDMTLKLCPRDDLDRSITGKCIYGLPAWFDENPQERKRLGWIKHIRASKKSVEYDNQTQFLIKGMVMIDDYTVQDVIYVMDKTEEMMSKEEVNSTLAADYDGLLTGGVFDD